ncbi:hypothetical protein [Winogradskyella sp. UBA3174]|uniref:hypothetical protein n=1 Tax=Winogradskyella sp. UBA3174 TaxID=1947785 RepID=UPI0025E287E9|nr:hypothetical protein [Winogradskyella sp. UBA3174]|tara:strand:+ start:28933 stop:31206 length:2274 start_codon:yes stop_codon:yes gene_type:complete
MKTRINHFMLLAFFALIGFSACQDEVTEINTPNEQEVIVPNSTLANLMSNTTAHFGAAQNILEDSNCFSIELPVTLIVSDITITIETEADLDQLEGLLDDINDNEDLLDFIFPITIIFSDFTELIIENEAQLESLITECDDEEENEIIECVDFVYPISFSVFNSEFTITDVVTINNDEEFYNFLDDLGEDDNLLIVSLNFPVALVYANGETEEVNSNEELAEAIAIAEEDCNDDDDNEDCNDEFIELALKECQWELVAYSSFPEFQGFLLEFNSDYTFNIILDENQILSEGNTWSVVSDDSGSFLVLDTAFEDLGGDWQIVECDDDRFEFTKNNETMVIEQECEGDLECSITDISSILQECPWDFSDGTDLFDNYQMVFQDNGGLQITEGAATSAIGGAWSLSVTDDGLVLTLSQLTAFQDYLEGDWLIVECDDDELQILRFDYTIVLEKNCYDETEVFNCFNDFEIVECEGSSNVTVYNLSANTIGLVDCIALFIPSFHATLIDAESNINPIENTEAYETLTAQVYLRIEAENGNFEIFNIYLTTEECNLFECFESFDAEIVLCDDANDGAEVFDLTIAFSNCTPSADAVTYYQTVQDANDGIFPIANPELYTNITAPQQTIYTRVEIGDQFEVFPIQLLLEDCSGMSNCTDNEVRAWLQTCEWNAVNYNGSDNLAEYNFDFGSADQIVIIYTDTITIDASWSVSESNNAITVEFSNIAGPNIQAITGGWLVVECEEDRLELHRGDDVLVLERTCN